MSLAESTGGGDELSIARINKVLLKYSDHLDKWFADCTRSELEVARELLGDWVGARLARQRPVDRAALRGYVDRLRERHLRRPAGKPRESVREWLAALTGEAPPTRASSVLRERKVAEPDVRVTRKGLSLITRTESLSNNTDDPQVRRLQGWCPRPKRPRYAVFASGWHGVRVFPCGSWNCVVCAANRLVEIQTHLDAVARPGEPLYDIHRRGTVDTVRRAVRRFRESEGWSDAPYLGVTLQGGGLYLICPFPLAGVGWKAKKHERDSFIAATPDRLFALNPSRAQWIGEWKLPETPKDKMLYWRDVRNETEARELAVRGGLDIDEPRLKESAPTVAERFRNLESEEQVFTYKVTRRKQ